MRRSFCVLAVLAFACGGSTTPAPDSTSGGGQGCTTEAMICPDGKTSVGRTGPSCTFAPCPQTDGGAGTSKCDALAAAAREKISSVVEESRACSSADDCVTFANATNCYDSCTSTLSKAGLPKLDAVKANVNANECAAFKQQGCAFTIPPCAPPAPPRCVDKLCQ